MPIFSKNLDMSLATLEDYNKIQVQFAKKFFYFAEAVEKLEFKEKPGYGKLIQILVDCKF